MEKLQALLVLHKKTKLSPLPIITGKANGKIQGKATLLMFREDISAVAALIYYLQQMSTKLAITHFDNLTVRILVKILRLLQATHIRKEPDMRNCLAQ